MSEKSNAENLCKKIVEALNNDVEGELPSEDKLIETSKLYRELFSKIYKVSDEEFEWVKTRVKSTVLHSMEDSYSIKGEDGEHQRGWYVHNENEKEYWNRFYTFLSGKWGSTVVTKLDKVTNEIMDDLGDPLNPTPFQRRGLLLGDVQSGKTATFTALCNKATDAGYKVIIVLAGLLESLRIQTQSRLDKEFVGRDSKYSLDNKATTKKKNKLIGVGNIKSKISKDVTRFTSVIKDFNAEVVNANDLNLKNLSGTALFVVKKNAKILNNLYEWLTKYESDIDLPLLLIDDEADNASINTNDKDQDPTAINAAIKKILNSFRRSSYVGITATPFANIFIDPDYDQNGIAKDLFPRHFLTLLPVPDNYVSSSKIFGNPKLSEDQYESVIDSDELNEKGKYSSALETINEDEMEDYFKFGHKKDIELYELPRSLKKAIRYFILVTGITDLRGGIKEHRTMMINVTRFTNLQNRLAELVNNYVDELRDSVSCYYNLDSFKWRLSDEVCDFEDVWFEFNLSALSNIDFDSFLHKYLNKSIERVKVFAVNQSTGSKSLDYYDYENTGLRVIAVGGNSLSRGLTLEGLITTYFYRNTKMYDTLLQMGRWFGYRPEYDDLFKIWMGEESQEWYTEISDAVCELKNDLKEMSRKHLTPEEFGLKVRYSEGGLLVTARNKMREGEKITIPLSISGRMVETSRLIDDVNTINENNDLCIQLISKLMNEFKNKGNYDSFVKASVWRKIPKEVVADFVEKYKSHIWNLGYQGPALKKYILNNELNSWTIGIPIGSGENLSSDVPSITTYEECRKIIRNPNPNSKMLLVNGHHVRIGSGGCTKIGLSKKEIDDIRNSVKKEGKKATDKSYLSAKRDPVLLIHRIKVDSTDCDLKNLPPFIFGIGLGFPDTGKAEKKAEYVVNTTKLREEMLGSSNSEDEVDDDII